MENVLRWIIVGPAIVALTAISSNAAMSTDNADLFGAVREADKRVAQIGYSLAAANLVLCDQGEPGTGLVLHTLDEYQPSMRDEASAYFNLAGGLAIEAIVSGSPAESAGLKANDAITSINGDKTRLLTNRAATMATIIAISNQLAALPLDQLIQLSVLRNGKSLTFDVQPHTICRSRFEVSIRPELDASSDGSMVQVTAGLMGKLSDNALATVMAHEFAHNILHHPKRLDAANVSSGLLEGFGRNVRFVRQVETQADILSVDLLANAGYDPFEPGRFWRGFGAKFFGSAFNSRSHPDWRDRATTVDHEAANVAQHSARPIVPAILATRDQPLDGNWRAILIMH
jgi:membrane-associated protease RseP (regulator of RpoE activity)